MKCIRSPPDENDHTTKPCQRCQRANRVCKIPEPKKLGRRRGATGRYHGIEKAYRKIQSELKKTRSSRTDEAIQNMANFAASEELTLDFIPNDLVGTTEPTHESFENAEERFYTPEFGSDAQDVHVDQRPENAISQPGHEPVSNPLALLADASGALEPLEPTPVSFITSSSFHDVPSTTSRPTSASNRPSLSREVLHRPGYVSLGLTLNKTTLEAGIDALIHNAECPETYSNYFKTPSQLPRRDIGPDVDPVDLGLVTMDEANFLFPM